MSKQPHVWVVEEFWASSWVPLSEIYESRQDALQACREWTPFNDKDTYRVAKYVRVEPKKGRKP